VCGITPEFDFDYNVMVASPSWEGYELCTFVHVCALWFRLEAALGVMSTRNILDGRAYGCDAYVPTHRDVN
jgi:hypothetical protein